MEFILSALKNNKLAFLFALLIGLICIAPHIIFSISLGNEYQGIYLSKTANELEYLARIQEIADGHWSLGSVPFFEYKDNLSLLPPNILEFFSALSVPNIVILSKFFLPALLFLLIYFFIRRLTAERGSTSLWRSNLHSIAAGLLIVLGYDLIDYRSLFRYFQGTMIPNDFLLWTRPSNPILGAILIYLFLLIVWNLYKSENYKPRYIFGAGLALAFGFMSYFFTWGIILSVMGLLFVAGLLKARRRFIKSLIFIGLLGFLLALPYFYNIFTAMSDSSYLESAMRTGFSLTHDPILNKFLIFSLSIFLILTLFGSKSDFDIRRSPTSKDWWSFSLVLILAGFIAFNQQIITGKVIWPFHFVQYTIPLGITAIFIAFYNIAAKRFSKIWLGVVIFTIIASISFGVYIQASTYQQSYLEYKEKQKYGAVFDWINQNTLKDSVILADDYSTFLNEAILAYTHSNNYLSGSNGAYLIPFDRVYHNYLVSWRLYGEKNDINTAVYFYGTEGLQYGSSSLSFLAIKDRLVSDYEDFLKKDLMLEIKKYKVDYLITEGETNEELESLIKELDLVYTFNNSSIYEF